MTDNLKKWRLEIHAFYCCTTKARRGTNKSEEKTG